MPYKDKEKQKEANKGASKRYRQKGMTKGGMTAQGMTKPGRLFAPSKFLSEEEDLKVEQSVREHLLMSGSRLASFRNLANTFVPNKVRDPSLVVPKI